MRAIGSPAPTPPTVCTTLNLPQLVFALGRALPAAADGRADEALQRARTPCYRKSLRRRTSTKRHAIVAVRPNPASVTNCDGRVDRRRSAPQSGFRTAFAQTHGFRSEAVGE